MFTSNPIPITINIINAFYMELFHSDNNSKHDRIRIYNFKRIAMHHHLLTAAIEEKKIKQQTVKIKINRAENVHKQNGRRAN